MQMITRTIVRALIGIVALVSLIACGQRDDYALAAELAKSGKLDEARVSMIKVAQSGNIHAMAWLMQDATNQGLAKPSARKQFVLWAERCADQGNVTCAESAGIFYWSGIDGAIDFERAEKWFVKAKASDSTSAGGWLEDVRKRKPASSSIRKLEA
jgi:TPR repeat protein